MRYDFPVPAVPETIILRGGGLLAVWCCWTMEYTCSCFPYRLAGLAVVVNTCCPAACLCWEIKEDASSMLGYDWAETVQSMSSWMAVLGCISAFWRQMSIHSSVALDGGAMLCLSSSSCIYKYMYSTRIKRRMLTTSPLHLHWCHRFHARVAEDDTCHPRDWEGSAQTAGMQHKHRYRCHTQTEGHPCNGKVCVASVTGDSIVHTCHQQDQVKCMVEG